DTGDSTIGNSKRFIVAFGVQPLVRHAASREKCFECMHARRPTVPNNAYLSLNEPGISHLFVPHLTMVRLLAWDGRSVSGRILRAAHRRRTLGLPPRA